MYLEGLKNLFIFKCALIVINGEDNPSVEFSFERYQAKK